MAEPNVSVQTQREAPFLEDYRRRLLESSFKKADVPTTTHPVLSGVPGTVSVALM